MATNDANPLPGPFGSTDAFNAWVGDNPGVGWRNVDLTNSPPPPTWQGSLQFGNPSSEDGLFLFIVTPIGLKGTPQVTVQCAEAGPNPPIDSHQENVQAVLPAGFQGVLDVRAEPPAGQSWPQGAKLQLSYYQVGSPSSGQSSRRRSQSHASLQAHGWNAERIANFEASAGHLTPIGSYTVRIG